MDQDFGFQSVGCRLCQFGVSGCCAGFRMWRVEYLGSLAFPVSAELFGVSDLGFEV